MALAVAAQKTKKAVRCMLDRDTDMCIAGQRHPFLFKYKVAYTDEGLIQALECEVYATATLSIICSRMRVARQRRVFV